MIRLLFVTPGNNAAWIASALQRIPGEQGVELEARHLLAMDLAGPSQVRERLVPALAEADVVLFDLRDARDVVAALREDRAQNPGRTYVPLMGGSTDILTLCRMGPFNLDRLARSRGGSVNYARIQQITQIVDKLGGLLPFGALKHARCWVHVVRYWTAGGQVNVDNLLRLVLRTYCKGHGPRPAAPIEPPVHRIEDPRTEEIHLDLDSWRARNPPDPTLPTVGLLFYGGMHHEASVVGARALTEALQGRANVIPVATDGVQGLDAVRRFLLPARPDVLVSLLWFRLDGGPMGGDPQRTLETLREIDAPWLVPVTLYNRERSTWEASAEGTSPVETFATVVLPELDGATNPIPILALERRGEVVQAVALPERVERLAGRILALARLRRTPRSERRVAVVVYDYPPGAGNAGNASYLDVGQSLANILRGLAEEGYDLGGAVPDDPLGLLLAAGLHNGATTDPGGGERLSRESWCALWASIPEARRREVETFFGPSREQEHEIHGRWFGKIFVGFQPARAATTHDRSAPPHPGYLAFYAWLQEADVHACVHVGTHGTVEFLPGKEMALSASCFPDLLQGNIPQVYLYTVANPSEATLAKRRWQATLVDHHLPDFVPAGLYGEYRALLDALERMREPGADAALLWPALQERAAKLELPAQEPGELEDTLRDQAMASIPEGLHVFGRPKDGRGLMRWLVGLARRPVGGWRLADLVRSDEDEPATLERWHRAFVSTGELPADLASRLGRERARSLHERLAVLARAFLADGEKSGLSRALDGRFVTPGLMGDPLRSPEIYPTGRNGCAFDPTRIPHPDAVARGASIGRRLLEAHVERTASTPRTLGLILWGFETARTGGETIGALLWLVGARIAETPGWLPAFEPIPLTELGRPRIDVHLGICGFFRDMFPNLIRDLDRLLRRIAALDEPETHNPMRAQATHSAEGDLALSRIFGPAPGEYGTALPDLVEASGWRSPAELAQSFQAAMGHAYGEGVHGRAAHAAHRSLLTRTDAVSQIVDGDDYKLGDLDHYYEFFGGLARAVTEERGSAPVTLAVDSAGAQARVEEAGAALRRCSATRLENPRWIEGMLAHPLHGGKKIADRVTNLLGLAGTLDCVPSSAWDRVFARYIEDEALFRRLTENNRDAATTVARRMVEARQRGFWTASEGQWDTLRRRMLEIEGEEEGVE